MFLCCPAVAPRGLIPVGHREAGESSGSERRTSWN